jgi:hypothetical protein
MRASILTQLLLKQNFSCLGGSKTATEDPEMLSPVCSAKQINREIHTDFNTGEMGGGQDKDVISSDMLGQTVTVSDFVKLLQTGLTPETASSPLATPAQQRKAPTSGSQSEGSQRRTSGIYDHWLTSVSLRRVQQSLC